MTESLGMACLRGLSRGENRVALIDGGMAGRELKAGLLLGAGLALAQKIRQEEPGPRVGSYYLRERAVRLPIWRVSWRERHR